MALSDASWRLADWLIADRMTPTMKMRKRKVCSTELNLRFSEFRNGDTQPSGPMKALFRTLPLFENFTFVSTSR